MIPETFLSSVISTAYVVAGDPVYHIDLGNLHDDEAVVAGSKSKIYRINKVDTTLFYDDSLRAQMDGEIWSVFFMMSNISMTSSRIAFACMVLLPRK